MNNTSVAAAELIARSQWALALIAELVQAGRAAGWLTGEPVAHVMDSRVVLDGAMPNAAGQSPMQLLAAQLDLSPCELDVLWLLVCVELDPHVSRASQLLLTAGVNELSAQMIERLVAHGGTLVEDVFERLDRLALIEMVQDPRVSSSRRSVRAADRVVDLARGRVAIDRSLRTLVSLENALDARRITIHCNIDLPEGLRNVLRGQHESLVSVTGAEGSGRRTLIRHAVSSCGRGLLTIRSSELATDENGFVRQLRAISRECCLHGAWPLFIDADCLTDRVALIEREMLNLLGASVFVTMRESCAWSVSRPIVSIAIAMPDTSKRAEMWQRALPSATPTVVGECARRYTIGPDLIAKGAAAAASMVSAGTEIDVSLVHTALRTQIERRLTGVARRIETRQTWNDLVLPVDQFDLLIELVARVRHKDRVLQDWGFADKVGRGLGLSALLSGPPGTGKTMIAGLVAQELGLDLYQVDLSKIVSKYIGETEKQLSALFEAAESGHAILLFDEADSLFAKRTEVKGSNDRYANLEVNYLLQRIEAFSGITLLTTNHETSIDQAFMRRLAFHVRVPMPDERQRELIWRSMLPAKAKRAEDLDFSGLATQFVMSGGYIKNAMLRAAYLCAEEGSVITNDHLWRAARGEYEAMGKFAYQPARLAVR